MSDRLVLLGDQVRDYLVPCINRDKVDLLVAHDKSKFKVVGTLVRTYLPDYRLIELGSIRITLILHAYQTDRLTRASFRELFEIDTVCQKRIDKATDLDDGDRFLRVCEQVQTALETANSDQFPARWTESQREVLYGIEEANTANQLATVIRHRFVHIRAKRVA